MSTPSKELLSEVFNTTVKNIELDRGQTEVKIYRENTSCLGTYNIYELAFRTREYLKTKSKHLSLNQSIDDIFKEANDIYESLSK